MMARFSAFWLCFWLLFPGPATAGAAAIREIPYPTGKSYAQTAQETVVPFFAEELKDHILFTGLEFRLFHRLTPQRKAYLIERLAFDLTAARKKFEGAQVHYPTDAITLAGGSALDLPNRTVTDRLALGYAAYDMGKGLIIDFRPLPYKMYYAPMSPTHLRAYLISPDGSFFDKTYNDLCSELRRIHDPLFYFTAIDAALRGDFSLAAALPPSQQEALADMIGIAIAEQYLQFKTGNPYNKNLLAKTGPFYNLAIDTLLYNHGGRQLTGTPEAAIPARGNCAYFMDNYTSKARLIELNARLTTTALQAAMPLEFAVLAARTGKYTLHAMTAYFAEHPGHYDTQMRLALRHILMAMPGHARRVNRAFSEYAGIKKAGQ